MATASSAFGWVCRSRSADDAAGYFHQNKNHSSNDIIHTHGWKGVRMWRGNCYHAQNVCAHDCAQQTVLDLLCRLAYLVVSRIGIRRHTQTETFRTYV